jgi:hypothetical protein
MIHTWATRKSTKRSSTLLTFPRNDLGFGKNIENRDNFSEAKCRTAKNEALHLISRGPVQLQHEEMSIVADDASIFYYFFFVNQRPRKRRS